MSDWMPGASRRPGPEVKTSGRSDPKIGAVFHSSEGSLVGAFAVLDNTRRDSHGRMSGSWHFTNAKDGRLFQHYPVTTITWHAKGGNTRFVGIEDEGVAGELLTDAQVANAADIAVWLKQRFRWPALSRALPPKTLWEHNEVGREDDPPYATACPSQRIPWGRIILLADMSEGDDDMDAETDKRFKQTALWAEWMSLALQGKKPTAQEVGFAKAVIDQMAAG